MRIETNLETVEKLKENLGHLSNWDAKEKCSIYVYFAKKENSILPAPRVKAIIASKTRGGSSDKSFLREKFNLEKLAEEALKSVSNNGHEIECVFFHYGKEI